MISLVLAMVWNRRGQAVTLALLAMLAVASAVAAPAYLIAAERAVAEGQIATATPNELSMAARRTTDRNDDPSAGIKFPDVGRVLLLGVNGFTFYHSAEVPTVGLEKLNEFPTRLVFRQDICAHVRILTGRCLAGEGDVLLGEHTARRLELRAGDTIELTAARMNGLTRPPVYEPDGAPKTLTVTGTYRAADPADAYWGLHGYFVSMAGFDVGPGEPAFTNAVTLDAMQRTITAMAIDGIAEPGTLDADRLGAVRADMNRLKATAAELEESLQFDSGIPGLLDRIDEGQSGARLLVPVLSVPLVLLACFTIYLVVGYGAEGRQSELAVVALRGSRWWTRWWLATGESLVAVLAGAVAGCLAGQLLVNAAAAVLYPGVGSAPALSSLRYAPLAAVAALLAAVAAQRRQLVSPVAKLLRRTPAADRRRLAVTEAVLAALAVAAGVQYYLSEQSLTGVGLFAPALIVLALALLAARLLLPLVNRYAVRALGRGRLGTALAGLQLSRRPGAGRLFALLVASVAVAGYAACTVDTAARGRDIEARVGTGAERVLTVQSTGRQQLLAGVRAVDPHGNFAMAAVRIPAGAGAAPGIAVDTLALPAVAAWPDGTADQSGLRDLLHPPAPAPLTFSGPDLVVEADTKSSGLLRLAVSVSSLTGPGGQVVDLGDMRQGSHTYRQSVAICEDGCRIQAVKIAGVGSGTGVTGEVLIRGINTDTAAPLGEPSRWRANQHARLASTPDGLLVMVTVSGAVADTAYFQLISTPYPLPIGYAGPPPPTGTIADSGPATIAIAPVAGLPVVPGIGRHAVLVDLEYSDTISIEPKLAPEPQVWLNARAPADIVERLAEHGLTVVSETSAAQIKAGLDHQGPAVALWFHVIAAILAGLLGAGALGLTVAVDRTRRTEDLAALRIQGLRPRPAGLATLWTYPVLVIIATAVGLLVAVAAWRLTGWALPLAGVDPPDLPLPSWPRPSALLGAAGAVLAVQFLVAILSGRNLRRRIESR
ncbi:FtsX-like permease family protein [Actinoplanes sp. NPDC023801]|uniref:FtsX-like permease family protein n=1 Tax=Actinoplanes sp. NPDC023801 TaxID=3154595 RepID=UPI0034017002